MESTELSSTGPTVSGIVNEPEYTLVILPTISDQITPKLPVEEVVFDKYIVRLPSTFAPAPLLTTKPMRVIFIPAGIKFRLAASTIMADRWYACSIVPFGIGHPLSSHPREERSPYKSTERSSEHSKRRSAGAARCPDAEHGRYRNL